MTQTRSGRKTAEPGAAFRNQAVGVDWKTEVAPFNGNMAEFAPREDRFPALRSTPGARGSMNSFLFRWSEHVMKYPARGFRALIYGCCVLALAVGAGDAAFAASGMTVAPLADDFGGQTSNVPSAGPGTVQAPATPSGDALAADPAGNQRRLRDGTVLAYLIELARKQDRPCPSGVTPPAPPSLIYSEPLCRVAEAAAEGGDVRAAMGAQGLYAARWRTFSASDSPAQSVAISLREKHCEALLEPHTHIGVAHGPAGWSVVMAELADKPPVEEPVVPAPMPTGGAPAAAATASASVAAVPGASPDGGAAPAKTDAPPATLMQALLPGEAEVPGMMAHPSGPASASAVTGQEARALFMRINEQREKGGSCLGRAMASAPPLVFDPALQAAAELAAAGLAAGDSPSGTPGTSGAIAGVEAYTGTQVTKLTAKTGAPVSAVVDIWMLNPNNCGVLLSPLFTDVGVAHADGNWVALIGAKGKGVPSPEPGQPSRQP